MVVKAGIGTNVRAGFETVASAIVQRSVGACIRTVVGQLRGVRVGVVVGQSPGQLLRGVVVGCWELSGAVFGCWCRYRDRFWGSCLDSSWLVVMGEL